MLAFVLAGGQGPRPQGSYCRVCRACGITGGTEETDPRLELSGVSQNHSQNRPSGSSGRGYGDAVDQKGPC